MNPDYMKRITVLVLLAGALTLSACGGSDSESSGSESTSAESTSTESGQMPAGGMFANLSDEDVQCLEDEGVTLPTGPPEGMPEGEAPEGMPEGEIPEGMPEGAPPEGMPEGGPPEGMPEGMEGMQEAMSTCGIEMPEPPSGEEAPVTEDAS